MSRKRKLSTAIICPCCRDAQAHISYQGNQMYEIRCPKCGMVAYHSAGSWAEAQAYFENLVLKKEPDEMEGLKNQVCALLDHKKFWDAIRAIQDAFLQDVLSKSGSDDGDSDAQGLTEEDYEE